MDQDTLRLVLLALGVVILFLAGWVLKLQGDFARLSRRTQTQVSRMPQIDLTTTGLDILDQTNERLDDVTRFCRALDKDVRRCVQHLGLIRFNAFEETGGDQSFALAMLDDAGNGVMLYGLHARAGSRLYAKPIQQGMSPYPLSGEEEEALKIATSSWEDAGFDPEAAGTARQKNSRGARR